MFTHKYAVTSIPDFAVAIVASLEVFAHKTDGIRVAEVVAWRTKVGEGFFFLNAAQATEMKRLLVAVVLELVAIETYGW